MTTLRPMALTQRHLLPFIPFVLASTFACSDGGSGGTATGGALGTGGASGGTNATGGAGTGGVSASGGAPAGGAVGTGGSGAVGATGSAGTGGNSSTGGTGGGTLVTGGSESGGAGSAAGGTRASGGVSSGGGSATGGTGGGTGGTTAQAFALSSPSWDAVDNDDCTETTTATCPLYPQDNTSFGANVSPEMSWPMGPEGTQSYAVVLTDLSNGLTHWALWDVPPTVTLLPASLPSGSPLTDPAGASQTTDFGQKNYFGSGACGHVYEHHLYALSVAKLQGTFPKATDVGNAIQQSGAILAESFVRLQSRDYCQ